MQLAKRLINTSGRRGLLRDRQRPTRWYNPAFENRRSPKGRISQIPLEMTPGRGQKALFQRHAREDFS